MELAMKISKDVRKLWRDCCAKNSSSAPCAVTERGINEILDDVEALETALSAVPETGAQGLTDAELVSWIDENWLKFSSDGKYCRAASEAGCRAMFYAFRTWLAARRPSAAPEPVILAIPPEQERHEFENFHRVLCERFGYCHDPVDWKRDQVSLIEHIASLIPEPSPQDDADVVDEMRTAYATAVHEQPPEDGWSAARAVARRGMVTLDEVEKAIVGVWVEGGHNNLPDFVAATRAGLTAKSTKQERVTVVGAVVYLDGKEFAVFKGHDSNCPAEKYAAGLRQFLAETK